MSDVALWLRDWRAWAFVAAAVVVGFLNFLIEYKAYELAIPLVPVMASIVLARPTLTAAVGLVTVAIALAHAGWESYAVDDTVALAALLVIGTMVSVYLAYLLRGTVDKLAAARDALTFQLENSADVLFRTSHDGVFEYFTPTVREMTGWEPAELVGRPAREIVHPEDQERLREAQSQVRAGEALRVELRLLQRDGSYRWTAVRLRPYRNDLGEVAGRTGSWRDISAQHAAEEALVASERQSRLVLENMSDVTVVVRDGVFQWVSPSMLEQLGWAPDELIGQDPAAYFAPDTLPILQFMIETTQRGGGASGRVRLKDAGGGYHWAAARMRVFVAEDGVADGRVTTFRLIDEEVAAEEAVLASQQLLASGLASELDPHLFVRRVAGSGTGRDYEVVAANPASASYFARSVDELVGSRLLTDHLIDYDGAVEALDAVVATGEPLVWTDVRVDSAVSGRERRLDLRATRTVDGASVVWRDVTDIYLAREALAASEERFRLLAENSTDVVLQSVNNATTWISPALTGALGWAPAEWQGVSCGEFVHPDDAAEMERAYASSEGGERNQTRLRMRDRDGAFHWVEVRSGPFHDARGTIAGVVASFHIVDAEVAAQQELERRARYDDLTGLLKRNEALTRLDTVGRHPRRPGGFSAVLFIDLDDFKSVNDTFGHAAGDAVLRALSQRIRSCLRSGDTVARMGGDEFLAILEGLHSLDEAATVAEKIRRLAEDPVETAEGQIRATTSIGVTLVDPVETGDEMVARADAAMYAAKSSGRNQVTVFGEAGET